MPYTAPRQLAQEEAALGQIDEVTQARIRSMDADTRARFWMVIVITALFVLLNGAVIWLIWQAFNTDVQLLKAKLIPSDQRLITDKVFMSLVGATTVQAGAALVGITRYLFPKRGED